MADEHLPEVPQTASPDAQSAAPDAQSNPPDVAHQPGGANGEFEIGDTVIAKIAHMACREVEGVHALGGATSRALSSLRVADTRTQGVTVDLRGDSVDVDITLVVTYGRSIPEVAQACREQVRTRIEATTGLAVKTVNVVVSDIYFPEGASGSESGQV
jgi:uncharacterized alkaline shock family protein YloU